MNRWRYCRIKVLDFVQSNYAATGNGKTVDVVRAIWSYYTYSYWLALATVPPAYFLQDQFAYVPGFERFGPCLSFWSLCWHCCCSGGRSGLRSSGLRSAVRGDLVVPGYRTEWGSRSFAVAGPKCWNKLKCWNKFCRDLSVRLKRFGLRDLWLDSEICGWTQRFVGWSWDFC